MTDKSEDGVHWSFWIIGVVTLIWNVMGGINFFMQMDASVIASFPESQRAMIESRPLWATSSFALAVFGGVLGCLLLLFRKSVAYYVFIASFIGMVVTMVHALGIAASSSNRFEIVMMLLMPLLVAAFLIWYAKRAERKTWIV